MTPILPPVWSLQLSPAPTLVPANEAFAGLVSTLIVLLLVATLTTLVTRWLRIPYVIGLVLAGLATTRT